MGFYPAREAVQKLLGFETADRQPTRLQHYSVTVVVFMVILYLGVTVQSLGRVYALIGGFCATSLAYIVPAAAYLVTRRALEKVEYEQDAASSDTPSSSTSSHIDEETRLYWEDQAEVIGKQLMLSPREDLQSTWGMNTAAGLLIVWGFIVMIFSTSGAFT